jgi:hypothetical protein
LPFLRAFSSLVMHWPPHNIVWLQIGLSSRLVF